MTDPRFERSVICICSHTEDGAMGLVINHMSDSIDFPDLLNQLDVDQGYDDPNENSARINEVIVQEGGPVETGRGFILHSADYVQDSTLVISETMALTATVDILAAIAQGKGPQHFIVALGYAGWGEGQLENEILQNSWLNIEADEELVFNTDLDLKWPRAMAKLGIDISMLSSDSGRA